MNNEQSTKNFEQPGLNIDPRSSNADADEINLLDLLLVLARHWKMIVGGAVAAGMIAAVLSLFMTNIYTTKAMILPGDNDNGGIGAMMMAQLGGLAGLTGGLGTPTKSELYVTMLKSETVKAPIVDRLKLMDVYNVKLRTTAYVALEKNSSISLGKKDGVITIKVDDRDPKLAAAIATAFVDELGKMAANLNMTGAGQNRVFLENRLGKAKLDLAEAEEKLKSFQSKNKAISVTDQAKATLEGIAQLRAQLVAQEVQLGVLQRQFTDSSQEVKAVKSAISNLRGQISRFEGNDLVGSLPGVGSMPELGQEYMRLMREFKIQETLVELLTKQFELSKLNEVKDIAPFQIIQKATVPELKSKPNRRQLVLMSTTIVGILIVFVVFIREYFNRMSAVDKQRWQQIKDLFPKLYR